MRIRTANAIRMSLCYQMLAIGELQKEKAAEQVAEYLARRRDHRVMIEKFVMFKRRGKVSYWLLLMI